jgi:hypothetical protein
MARVLCWTTAAFLGLFAVIARAASDWVDELPTVTTVAHAVTEQLQVDTADWRFDGRGIALKDDDDLFAVYLVGTLVLLRKIILFKYQEDQSLSPEREEKLRSAVAAYLEAELLIGQAVGTRPGYLTTAQKCRDIACYRRWFKTGYSNVYISASYRQRILPRLFPCDDRAAELDRLAQSYAGRTPYLPSPAETQSIPPEVAGVAPPGCSVYGGDANGNGLCEDWEKPAGSRDAQPSTASACAPIVMDKVRLANGGGLKVTLAKDGGKPGATVAFRVWRSAQPAIPVGVQPVWTGSAVIQPGTKADSPLQVILAQGAPLAAEPTLPFLVVEVTSGRSPGPVSCEQPLQDWQLRQRAPPDGLHGPYPDVVEAMKFAGYLALTLTGNPGESGFVVLRRDPPSGPAIYYTTAPTPTTQPGGVPGISQPKFGIEDYGTSLRNAFRNSCEAIENFVLIGTAHTHPQLWLEPKFMGPGKNPFRYPNDNFSMNDFNQAFQFKDLNGADFGGEVRVRVDFEAIFLLPMRTVCFLKFEPRKGEPQFSEEDLDSWTSGLFPLTWDLYLAYVGRQRQLGCLPQSIKN